MDWLKDAVVPVAQTGIWATMLYLLGIRALGKFEQTISRTFDRLKKAGPAEFESLSTTNQLKAKVDPSAAILPPIAPFSKDSLPAFFESKIREATANLPAAERENNLMRGLALTQIAWIFEALNFLIWGSQLALVQALNSGSMPIEQARAFYTHAATVYPDVFKTYSFDAWLEWFVSTAKFVMRDGESLHITEEGREFLRYLVTRGYTLIRLG